MTLSETLIGALTVELDERNNSPRYNTFEERSARTPKRAIVSLHDSLASLLVSAEESEVIAVGSALLKTKNGLGLELFVVTNYDGNVTGIECHLERLWREFLSRSCLSLLLEEPPESVQYNRFKDNNFSQFFEELRDGSKYIYDAPAEGKGIAYIRPIEVFILDCLRSLCDVLDGSRPKGMEEMLDLDDMTALENIPDVIKLTALALIAYVHMEEEPKSKFFSRCDAILQEIAEARGEVLPECGTFERFWTKVAEIEECITAVLTIRCSTRYRDMLEYPCIITPVSEPPVLFQWDSSDDEELLNAAEEAGWTRETFKERWIGRQLHEQKTRKDDSPTSYERPHSECSLLAYLLNHRDSVIPYGYIGLSSSEDSCIGCRLYFSAYNKVAERRGLLKFFTRMPKAHSQKDGTKTHHCKGPWVKPMLHDEQLNDEIEQQLRSDAMKYLFSLLEANDTDDSETSSEEEAWSTWGEDDS